MVTVMPDDSVIENPDRKRMALTVLRHRLKLEILHPEWRGGDSRATILSAKDWLGIPRSKRMNRAALLELVTKELEN